MPPPILKWVMEQLTSIVRLLFVTAMVCLSTLTVYADLWVTGYYPGWEQAGMPASSIDFTTLTHIIHFSVVPNSDGTLNSSDNSITPANSADLVSHAHAAGRPVLICVGGAGSESLFQGAASTANLPAFISNLTNFVATRGYDGVDIDWEPLPSTDALQFTNLVNGLRSVLNGFPQHKLLTAAAGAYPPYGDSATAEYAMFASLQNQFDQINIMTYDLSGPYPGWVTWFNSPIYDGGYRFPSSSGLVPSVDGAVNNFLNNGVASDKLGIGIAFYGYVWLGGSGTSTGGVTQPRQSWTNAPTVTTPSFTTIMTDYYQSNLYQWDASAQAAYLSISNANPASDMFISFDNQRTCQAKVSYARNHALGGVMIWELAQDHTASLPDPLLQSINQALATPGNINGVISGNDLNLSFTSIALGSYQIQWTSNLTAGNWNNLFTTNVNGLGGVIQYTDVGTLTNEVMRFYRILTPP
jgi:chitinase